MKKILLTLFTIVVITGCKKYVDVGEPIDKITTANAFSNDASATSAVLGVYSQMMLSAPYIMSGATTIYTGLSSDELTFTGTTASGLAFNTNSIPANNGNISTDFWLRAYFHIYQVNACLEGLEQSKDVTTSVKTQLKGELLFLRSYVYYYLANLFGNVPCITVTDYAANATLGRVPVQEIYQHIIDDLQQAKQLLPATYPSGAKGRVNKYAASALLARIYLYRQQWQLAEDEATSVIASSGATMVYNLNNVFLANSSEALWQLVPVQPGFNTTEGSNLIPAGTSVKPLYAVTNTLVNAFENNDQRKAAWLKFNTVSSVNYYYPFKYKVRLNATVTEYYMMLRLAEQYLIRAEARAQLDKVSLAQADINIIRNRAGLANTTANNKTALLSAIEQENRIEFFAEWGHRWFDLKRTGRINAVMSAVKPTWQSYAALYPIPQGQIDRNNALTQNPGY